MKLIIEPAPEGYTDDRAAILMDEESGEAIVIGCPNAALTCAEIAYAVNHHDAYDEALRRIKQWSEAYPLSVFPEPDLSKARELLEAGGITLDSISAHCMRHVIDSVGRIAKEALE